MKIEINKKNKTIKVIPELAFCDFEISILQPYFHFHFTNAPKKELVTVITGCALFFKDFGGRNHYPTSINIESITETEINLSYN